VSGAVVKLTVLLLADRLPAIVDGVDGERERRGRQRERARQRCPRRVDADAAGPPDWTQYHQFDELSVDGFHASETLFAVEAVMRRLLGVVGGVRSRAADAGAATNSRLKTSAAAMPTAPTDRYRDMFIPPVAKPNDKCHLHYCDGTPSGFPMQRLPATSLQPGRATRIAQRPLRQPPGLQTQHLPT